MTRTAALFGGKKGEKGQAGLNGVGSSDVRETLLENPILSLFNENRVTRTIIPTWQRETQGSIEDRYGIVRFVGGDTIDNLLPYSEDFSQWSDITLGWSITGTGLSDPLGGNNATRIRIDANSPQLFMGLQFTVTPPKALNASFWIKNDTGTVTSLSIQPNGSATPIEIDATVTSSWQRVNVGFDEFGTQTFYINVVGAVNTQFQIFGAQINSGSEMTEYLPTNGSPASQANAVNRWRQNNKGFLIESEKVNESPNSEDLSAEGWLVTNGTIENHPSFDPFNKKNSPIQIQMVDTACSLINDAPTVSSGQVYTVSFWLKQISGNIDSVIISVGNGGSGVISEGFASQFKRFSVQVTSGSQANLSILVSADTTGSFAITGIQAELGSLSSYISTAGVAATRAKDIVTIPYSPNFLLPSEPWTFLFGIDQSSVPPTMSYVFDNGQTGQNKFSLYFLSGSLVLVNGTDNIVLNGSGSFYAIWYDGDNVNATIDGELQEQQQNSNPSSFISSTLHIGSDSSENNQIESYLSKFLAYPTNLTLSEIRYLTGADYDNANS